MFTRVAGPVHEQAPLARGPEFAPRRARRHARWAAIGLALCLIIAPGATGVQAGARRPALPATSGIGLPGLSWSTTPAPLPHPLYRAATAVGQNGKIYVFGGGDGTTDYNTTYIYDPLRNRWSVGAPMVAPLEGAQAVTLSDGRIALLGGGVNCENNELCSTGTVYSLLNVYSPSSNSWMEYPAMLSPRYRFAAVYYHNQIFAMGGSNGSSILSSVESFNFTTATWTAAPSLPQPILGPAALVDSAGNIDVDGGTNLTAYFTTVYLFNGIAWSNGPALPQATVEPGATLGPGGRIYLLGGYTLQTDFLSIVQMYDPATAQWSIVTSLPGPDCCIGAVTDGGHIFSIGGYDGYATDQVALGTVWPAPTLTLSPNSGGAGTTTTVAGYGFGPGHTVQLKLYCSAPSCVSHTLLGTAVADLSGSFNSQVTIPGSTAPGGHEVGAIDTATSAFAGRTFTVTS